MRWEVPSALDAIKTRRDPAGVGGAGPLLGTDIEEMREVFDTNLFGAIRGVDLNPGDSKTALAAPRDSASIPSAPEPA